MRKELERLKKEPPHGVTCWCKEGKLNSLEANLLGGEGTPYEGGVFKLSIEIPNNYPFQPPHVQFLTQIYHPNIDTAGRICLDILKSPPTGSWKPAQNLHSILTSIQLLLAEPNPDDGLMADISSEYKQRRPTFIAKAKEWTRKHAMGAQSLKTGAKLLSKGNQETDVSESMAALKPVEAPKNGGSSLGKEGHGDSSHAVVPGGVHTKDEVTSQGAEVGVKLRQDANQDSATNLGQETGVAKLVQNTAQDQEVKQVDQREPDQRQGRGTKRNRQTEDEEENFEKKKFIIEL